MLTISIDNFTPYAQVGPVIQLTSLTLLPATSVSGPIYDNGHYSLIKY